MSVADFVHRALLSTYNPQRQKTYLRTCGPSEDSDQPAISRSLIRIFTGHILDSQGCKVSSNGQVRPVKMNMCTPHKNKNKNNGFQAPDKRKYI